VQYYLNLGIEQDAPMMNLRDLTDILIMVGVGLAVLGCVFYVIKQFMGYRPKPSELDPNNPIEEDDQVFLSRYVPQKPPSSGQANSVTKK
jgi:hypothetical protein